MLAQHAVARQVADTGFVLAPGAQLAQHRQLRAGQLPRQLGITVQLVRVDFAAQLQDQFGAVVQHPGVLVFAQTRTQAGIQLGQVHGVFRGIADLGFRQRTLQPVRARFALGQLDAEHFLHQPRVAHGETEVEVTGGQLGVEQGRRQAAGETQKDFEVFAAGMQHFGDGGVFEQFGQWLPVIDQQRVDQKSALPVADLDQTGFGIEGVDPHELGIECHEGQLTPLPAMLRQAEVVTNPVNIDGHKALPRTMARSIYGTGHCRETARRPSPDGL